MYQVYKTREGFKSKKHLRQQQNPLCKKQITVVCKMNAEKCICKSIYCKSVFWNVEVCRKYLQVAGGCFPIICIFLRDGTDPLFPFDLLSWWSCFLSALEMAAIDRDLLTLDLLRMFCEAFIKMKALEEEKFFGPEFTFLKILGVGRRRKKHIAPLFSLLLSDFDLGW